MPIDRRLVSLARTPYRWPLSANELDIVVYIAIRRELDWKRVYLIVESPDGRRHVGHRSGVVALYVPVPRSRAVGLLVFGLGAIRISLRLCRSGNTVLQASDPLGSGLPAVFLKKMLRVPTLVQLQGDLLDLPREIPRLKRFAMRSVTIFVLRRADRVRCVSRALVEKVRRLGIEDDRISYVPSRCDTERFNRPLYQAAAAQLRRRYGVGDDAKVILFVGALTIHKGLMHLIDATAIAVRAQLAFRLLIAGTGPLLGTARQRTRELRLDETIRFLGQIPYSDVPTHMAASDVFVLPSLDEGMPRVVLEAMAMELVVVASRVGGVAEAVVDGSTGFLVPPASAEQLADAMSLAIAEPHDGLRARARATVRANYDFRSGIRSYAEMVNALTPER